MTAHELTHLQFGRPLLRLLDGEQDLADDPALWGKLWRRFRAEALGNWIASHPGSRPPAWWEFDAPRLPARHEDEDDVAYLARAGQIGKAELALIAASARQLAWYDEFRDPGDPASNFIPPGEVHEFARGLGLLTPHEVEVLWPTRTPAERGRLFPLRLLCPFPARDFPTPIRHPHSRLRVIRAIGGSP